MNNIYDLTIEEMDNYFLSKNETKYRSKQIYDWLYKKRIDNYSDITNIKKELMDEVSKDFYFGKITLLKKVTSKGVVKFLFEFNDLEKIEAVLMFHDYGNSLCISTQVGCNMGCSFCESGRLKKVRNLTPGEMVIQILFIEKNLDIRISHVVLMGIGEPFDNYDNVLKFIKIINNQSGIEIGARHITVSTCGLVDKIKDFMNENIQVNLAISLHAPNDYIRDKIMAINKKYKVKDIIDISFEYVKTTGRRITFEYILLKDINDTEECAIELARLIRGLNCYVNLIPYNETSNYDYKRSPDKKINNFYDILKKEKISVTIRKEFGGLVDAACGQLRSTN